MPSPVEVLTALNVLSKVESSSIKLNGEPNGLAVLSAATTLSSAITNALSLTGLGLGNANALINGINVPMQLALLDQAIA